MTRLVTRSASLVQRTTLAKTLATILHDAEEITEDDISECERRIREISAPVAYVLESARGILRDNYDVYNQAMVMSSTETLASVQRDRKLTAREQLLWISVDQPFFGHLTIFWEKLLMEVRLDTEDLQTPQG
uniref:Inner membrane protein n=1 Tax=Steinernema glaseri TaxID=37863 RepID=A0A1I7ZR01_9BILA